MKILSKIFLMFFVVSCGYQPLLINKNSDFKFGNSKLLGDNKLSSKILNNLSSFKSQDSNSIIVIKSNFKKNVSSKDEKGNAEVYNIKIDVEISTKLKKKELVKSFSESISYNNRPSSFELKKYENSIIKTITEKISQDAFLYLSSL